ncbi:MAG TPA: tRNA-binding protein [candidate division Zixibacteria bacterium]|nr:tRNA-binding protein [candidate division Zixibacteria bacterium]
MSDTITFEDFEKVDIRAGKIIEVGDFEKAHFPTYKLRIDFGPEIGVKQSSARFKSDYRPEDLLEKQCLAVVNFAPKNIGGFMSEVLVLGVEKEAGGLSIVRPFDKAKLGARLY